MTTPYDINKYYEGNRENYERYLEQEKHKIRQEVMINPNCHFWGFEEKDEQEEELNFLTKEDIERGVEELSQRMLNPPIRKW